MKIKAENEMFSSSERVLKENEKINSLIKKLEEDSKERQWIQTVDDEYFAYTEKAMYADELLSFLRGEEKMNEEEKNVVERIEDTFYSDLGKGINKFQKITLYEDSIRDVRRLLNLLEKLQKENEQLHKFILEGITIENSPFQNYQLDFLRETFIPIWRIEKLIKELKQDDINMTRKYKEKKNTTGELLGIDKVRVRAYREKTREINEKLHKLLIETKGK